MSIQISDRSVIRTIKDLVVDFYVRKELNHDWALQLGEFVASGVELNPIFITRENKVIDGRHRIEGHEYAGKTEIKCKIVEADNDVELIIFAVEQNMGGSMPQNQGDMEHTLQELLNRGVPKKQLTEMFKGLPAKIVRKYLTSLESRMQRVKLQKAATAISDGGLTVPKAAEQYDVPEDQLRTLINTRVKGKTKRGIEESQRQLSTSYKSLGQRNWATVRRLMEAYQDGDCSHKQMMKIFSHLEHLIKQSSRKAADWKKRFETMEAPRKIA